MRLNKTQTPLVRKIKETIEGTEGYKKQLRKFVDGIKEGSEAETSSRIPSFLLTHFTDKEHAEKIIESGFLDINANRKGYVALTELSPLEYHTVTQNVGRTFGFVFFKRELVAADLGLYSPVATSDDKGIAAEILKQAPDLAKKLLIEPTETQPGISFLNMLEVRSSQNISLDRCRLFFREEDMDEKYSIMLNDKGIFQMPHQMSWFRDYFINEQLWQLSETGEILEFGDTRAGVILGAEQNLTSEKLLRKLDGHIKREAN